MSFKEKNPGGEVTGDFSQLDALIKELGKKYYVDIGILGESNETIEGGLTLAGIGAVHIFGTDKAGRGKNVSIPERDWLVMPLQTGQEQIEKQIKPKLKGDFDVKHIFTLIGIAGEARIKEAFETGGFGTWAPNAESTIKSKGSASPLIDDGSLRDAIMSKPGVA